MNVIIDGIEYVPKAEIPPTTDEKIEYVIKRLVGIQYFSECTNKHRAWAWEALNELAPNIAELCSNDSSAAFDLVNSQ
jgi:hypothetical protein